MNQNPSFSDPPPESPPEGSGQGPVFGRGQQRSISLQLPPFLRYTLPLFVFAAMSFAFLLLMLFTLFVFVAAICSSVVNGLMRLVGLGPKNTSQPEVVVTVVKEYRDGIGPQPMRRLESQNTDQTE